VADMAVVVRYDERGNPITRSLSGIGISEAEKEKAYELDNILREKLKGLTKKLISLGIVPKKGSKNKVEAYWELGSVLREIFFESELIIPAEKSFYWLNAKLHTPKELLTKDRGPHRIHIAYCFRLAGYPKKIALKRKWSEWVYLFDRKSINKEPRFDRWDRTKMEVESAYLNRKNLRFFSQCLNSMLKDIETKDLSDDELVRCYDGAWSLSIKLLQNFHITTKFKSTITRKIIEKQKYVGEIIESSITPDQFADIMTNEM